MRSSERNEARLRAMLDAKLKVEGIDLNAEAKPEVTNVVDLMAALRRILAQDDNEREIRHPQAGAERAS